MNDRNKLLDRYLTASLLLTALGTAAQTLALLLGYDTAKGVYLRGNSLGAVAGWALFVFVLILASPLFLLPKDDAVYPIPPCNHTTAFFAAAGGGIAVCSSFIMMLDVLHAMAPPKTLTILSILLFLLSLPTDLYLILSAILRKAESRLLTAFSFFPVLWVAACLIRIYFDRTSAINDPRKLLLQVSLAAIMIYFLTEARSRVGKGGIRFRFAAGMIAMLLGFASSVSMLALAFRGVSLPRGELLLTITELLLTLYILGRLLALVTAPAPLSQEKTADAPPAETE